MQYIRRASARSVSARPRRWAVPVGGREPGMRVALTNSRSWSTSRRGRQAWPRHRDFQGARDPPHAPAPERLYANTRAEIGDIEKAMDRDKFLEADEPRIRHHRRGFDKRPEAARATPPGGQQHASFRPSGADEQSWGIYCGSRWARIAHRSRSRRAHSSSATAKVLNDQRIHIVKGTIVSVEPWQPPQRTTQVIDWSGFTVLPGYRPPYTRRRGFGQSRNQPNSSSNARWRDISRARKRREPCFALASPPCAMSASTVA